MSIDKARRLRTKMTEAEKKLWYFLRDRRLGYKFRRQVSVGAYIVDFACLEASIAVEVDGGQHCENLNDLRRTEWLEDQGWHVLRFWNNEVLQQTEQVLEILLNTLRSSLISAEGPSPAHPSDDRPLPLGEANYLEGQFHYPLPAETVRY